MAWKGSARIKSPKRAGRHLWVGFKPYGAGETKPNHYKEIARTFWENRGNLPYAWKVLHKGVCDGCALGVAGFHDWTLSGVHLCTTRLNLLRVNTMGALDPAVLGDVGPLRRLPGKELRDLGRLGHPMVRRTGEPGFRRVSWDEALTMVADRIRASKPDRLAFYLTARGITNETYYVAQKTVRFLGTNNIDNAARVCHAPSTTTLKQTIGVGATTCSYTDVIESDLIVLFGANVANAQPVFMKYLFLARKYGAKVAVVNPLREPGLDRYWVPSNVESALFGTKMTDEFFGVHTGGDVAFVNGVLKVLLAEGGIDRAFVHDHTEGFDELLDELERESFVDLERQSGATRADMERFARMYAAADSAVLVWSMGITQHEHGSDNVAAIVNLGLARGNVGRRGAGLMPIRGHSGVQGGAEMGAYATAFPGGVPVTPESAAALAEQYGFPVAERPGLTAEEMVEAASRGEIDVLYSSGGNFLEVLPDPEFVDGAWRACRCACTRTSWCRARCSWTPPTRWCCCPRRRATSSAAAAPRPPPSAASRSAPRSAGTKSARHAASGRSSSTSPGTSIPSARTSRRSTPGSRSATRSLASCRRTRASNGCTPSATPSSGAGRASAKAGSSPRPTARRTSRRSHRSKPSYRRGRSSSAPAAASSSTRWCTRRLTP